MTDETKKIQMLRFADNIALFAEIGTDLRRILNGMEYVPMKVEAVV